MAVIGERGRSRIVGIVSVVAMSIALLACSSGGNSSEATTTTRAPSSSAAAPVVGIVVSGDLEGTLVLGPEFATCAGPECSGSVMIGPEVGTLHVSPNETRVALGEDNFAGPGTSDGGVSIPQVGTLKFADLQLKGSGVAAGEAIVITGTAAA